MIRHWTKVYTLVLIAILIASLIIYVIFFIYIIKPLQTQADTLNSEVVLYEKQAESLANKTNETLLDEELSTTRLKLPGEKTPNNVLRNLQQIANVTGVTISYIESDVTKQGEEEKESEINSTTYLLEVDAKNLTMMNNFLDEIVESERLFLVDTLILNQTGDSVYVTVTFSGYHTNY